MNQAPTRWQAAPAGLVNPGDALHGPFQTTRLHVGESTIRVLLSSGRRKVSDADVLQWVGAGARAVARYYGRYPIRHVTVILIVAGDGKIGHGRELEGRLIRIHFGSASSAEDLKRDWTMTHEMFHLAFPNLGPEYDWMNEGLSDYLEPVARERLGMISNRKLWGEMVRGLPQGLPKKDDQGLDRTHTWGRTYWGGTLYWLLADIRIREQTQGRRSLQNALRDILDAGGDGSQTWPLRRVLEIGDHATGTRVLSVLHEQMGLHPWAPDLHKLWQRLGVRMSNGRIAFNDLAPLAGIRRSISQHPR